MLLTKQKAMLGHERGGLGSTLPPSGGLPEKAELASPATFETIISQNSV